MFSVKKLRARKSVKYKLLSFSFAGRTFSQIFGIK